MSSNVPLVVGSAAAGAAVCALVMTLLSTKVAPNPETDYESAHSVVWRSIGGAMQASQLYLGDRLKLYATLRAMCAVDESSVTAPDLAHASGLKVRAHVQPISNASNETAPTTYTEGIY